MGVADTLRVIERASVASGVVTNDEFRTLLDTYTAMQRKRDPLAAIGAYFRRPTDRHTGCSPPPLPSCAHVLPNPPTTHTNAQARRFTLLPVRVAAMVAQDEHHKDVLVALGREVPKKWLLQERKDTLAAEGAVDFNTNAELEEESEDCDELAGLCFEAELSLIGFDE